MKQRNIVIFLFDLKIHTFRLSFFNILFNSGRERGLSFYEINRKKIDICTSYLLLKELALNDNFFPSN